MLPPLPLIPPLCPLPPPLLKFTEFLFFPDLLLLPPSPLLSSPGLGLLSLGASLGPALGVCSPPLVCWLELCALFDATFGTLQLMLLGAGTTAVEVGEGIRLPRISVWGEVGNEAAAGEGTAGNGATGNDGTAGAALPGVNAVICSFCGLITNEKGAVLLELGLVINGTVSESSVLLLLVSSCTCT